MGCKTGQLTSHPCFLVQDVKLKWDPRKGESLPEETMWVLYPKLQLLAAKEDLEELEELEGIVRVDA